MAKQQDSNSMDGNGPDEILGDPNTVPATAGPGTKRSSSPVHRGPSGETLGTPAQPAKDATPVSDADNLFLSPEHEEAWSEDITPADRHAATGLWRFLDRSGVVWFAILAVIALFLFLLAQVASLVERLQHLPPPLQTAGYALMAVLGVIVLISAIRLLVVFFRLRATPALADGALSELAERANTRRQSAEYLAASQKTLQTFLNRHPALDTAREAKMQRLGFKDEELEQLRRHARRLLEGEITTYESWLQEFTQRFLASLDVVAKRRVNRYARLVGLKTAAVPTGFADTAIVLINAYLMTRDLCLIYNLRTNWMGTIAVFSHVFVNAFTASRMEEWSDTAIESLFGEAAATSGELFAGIAKTAAARLAEGTANGMLFRRLGLVTIRNLRPVSFSTDKK